MIKGIRIIGTRFNSQEHKDASASVLPSPIITEDRIDARLKHDVINKQKY